MKLYPLSTIRTHNFKENTAERIGQLWQQCWDKLPTDTPSYSIYHNYEHDFTSYYDVTIAVEKPTNLDPIETEIGFGFEIFKTKADPEQIQQTWQIIWNKEKQGLLKRAYMLDI